jgi:hypothetical protein
MIIIYITRMKLLAGVTLLLLFLVTLSDIPHYSKK